MGIPTFLITATVEAILAQRLVRRICTQCREEWKPTREVLDDLELTPADIKGKRLFKGKGCEACNNTGYKGRVGLFEFMGMNGEIRELIMHDAPTDDLRDAARRNGMTALRDIGMQAMFEGTTSADEVIRETILEA